MSELQRGRCADTFRLDVVFPWPELEVRQILED